ncbi:hypothetical protein PHISP_05475 [Aspergillus sp. HF37]|nr:hypothetical protein PHISP_05475 [Aspergillus sp. HF37]
MKPSIILAPFPPASHERLYSQWTKWKSLNLRGAGPNNRLCLIAFQIGHSGKAPLGFRNGILLHDGMSTKDPILAAAGDESEGLYVQIHRMGAEIMHVAKSADHGVVFRVSMDAGDGEDQRENFEWRKVDRGNDEQAERKGFKARAAVVQLRGVPVEQQHS